MDAYDDDELASRAAAEVDAHLDACPVFRQRMDTRGALGRLIRGVPYYAAPDRLRVAVAATRRPARVSPQRLAWAAMVTLAVSFGSGVTSVCPSTASPLPACAARPLFLRLDVDGRVCPFA